MEDIPPSSQTHVEETWPELFAAIVQAHEIEYSDIECHASSRHIVLIAQLGESSASRMCIGPSCDLGEAALLGFVKKNHIESYEKIEQTAGVYKWQGISKGRSTGSLLPEILNQLIDKVKWAYMLDNWIRPVQETCCIWDDAYLRFHIRRLNLQVGSSVYVHPKIGMINTKHPMRDLKNLNFLTRFTDKVESVDSQLVELQKYQITTQQDKTTEEVSCQGDLTPTDQTLLHECIRITPNPKVIVCSVPSVLSYAITRHVLKEHLKLIPCADRSKFLMIANGDTNVDCVKFNMERAIEARLDDTKFFYTKDLQMSLEKHRERLKEREVFANLGTYFDKNRRIYSAVLHFFPDRPELIKAADLVYSDLFTSMVEEMPELEGTMARIYSGQPYGVIIENSTHNPCDHDSAMLAWCKSIDTLVGFTILGKLPSGSSDPLCLKREATKLVNIGFAIKPDLDWKELIRYFYKMHNNDTFTMPMLETFILQRVRHHLKTFNNVEDVLRADDSIWNAKDKCKFNLEEIAMLQKRLSNMLANKVLTTESAIVPQDLEALDRLLLQLPNMQTDEYINMLTQVATTTNACLDNVHLDTAPNKNDYFAVLNKVLQATRKILIQDNKD